MRSIWLVLLVLTCALGLTGVARAQFDGHYDDGYDYTDLPLMPWSIHAGVAWFTGNTENNTTWIAGVEYAWRSKTCYINAATNNEWTFGADYYPVQRLNQDTVSVVPVLLGYRWYGLVTGYPVYFGVGAGARWVSDDVPELNLNSGANFAWDAHAGIDFTPSVFGQLRFIAGSDPANDGLFSVELGVRW